MTPSDTSEQRNPSSVAPNQDLASLIAACGRDERPALKTLYQLTAPQLYSRAIAATSNRAAAEQALVQSYLTAFAEAEQFAGANGDPMAWLEGILRRFTPALPPSRRAKAGAGKPVEPPAELWQKLDIGIGLQRLDRHIKPGIATQARGRDPMPNAYDRRIEGQLRFWRVLGVTSFSAFALAAGFIAVVALRGGPLDLLDDLAAGLAQAPTDLADAAAAPARLAILRAADEGRLWRVDVDGEGLRVRALPPFIDAAGSGRPGVLALWMKLDPASSHAAVPSLALKSAPASGGAPPAAALRAAVPAMLHLADLDPAVSTGIPLPDGLTSANFGEPGIELVISLEPVGGAAADGPQGPVLFSGRLER